MITKWTTRNNNNKRYGGAFEEWSIRISLVGASRSPASGDRRHYRNSITVLDCSRFFIHKSDVLIVQVNIHKRTEFALVSIKMPPEVRVLGDQSGQGFGDGPSFHFDCRLFAGILP
jgi:hypothetical protein